MWNQCRQVALIGFIFLIVTQTAIAAEAKFYRYINENGELILTDQLPPEEGAQGYEVINKHGQVKEKIDPMLTEEERIAKEEEEKRKANDKKLQGLYSSYAEIDRARDLSIGQIEANITIIKANIDGMIYEREEIQENAAQTERKGKKVPEEVSQRLFNIDSKIKNENKKLQQQQEIKQKTADKFSSDRIRLGELLHLPAPSSAPKPELQPLAMPGGATTDAPDSATSIPTAVSSTPSSTQP